MDQNNLKCPVCINIMTFPRIYDCGHSLCEECMIQIDNETNTRFRTRRDAVIYKCPLCRVITHKPWFSRPKNLFLMNILESNEEYRKIVGEKRYENNPLDNIPENINLSFLCSRSREIKMNELYNYILPLLIKSCMDGKQELIISDRASEIYEYSSEISKKLFNNHGIYKIISTKDIFRIFNIKTLSNREFRNMQEYINPNYNSNIQFYDDDDDDDEEEIFPNSFNYQENNYIENTANFNSINQDLESVDHRSTPPNSLEASNIINEYVDEQNYDI